MATGEDAVLSYSEPEGSEFSGFGSDEVPAQTESQPVVEKSKNKKKKDKGKRPANPKSSATAKKSKPKNVASSAPAGLSVNKDNETPSSSFASMIESLTDQDIEKLRDIFGQNEYYYDEEENVQNLFGCSWNEKPNLTIELTEDSDGELVSAPKKSSTSKSKRVPLKPKDLSNDLINAMFEESENENGPENEPTGAVDTSECQTQSQDDFNWDLPVLKGPEKGPAISQSLADLINTACTSQCKLDNIVSKYKVPNNCDMAGSPSINSEIWKVMSNRGHSYDKCFCDIQNLLATGLVPVMKLIEIVKPLIKGNDEAKTLFSDVITLFGQVQYNLSLRRRYMIRPNLKKKYQDLCNINTPISTQLFGDQIAKKIKELDTSVSVGKENYPRYAMGNVSSGRPFRGQGNFRGGQGRGGRGSARYQPYPQQFVPYGYGQFGGQFGGWPHRGNYGYTQYPRGYPRQRFGSGRGKKQSASATVASAPNESA